MVGGVVDTRIHLGAPPLLREMDGTIRIGPPAAHEAVRKIPGGAFHAVRLGNAKTECGFGFIGRPERAFSVVDIGERCLSCDYSVRRSIARRDEVIELTTVGWPRGIVDFSGLDDDDRCGAWIAAMDQAGQWRPFSRVSPVQYWAWS